MLTDTLFWWRLEPMRRCNASVIKLGVSCMKYAYNTPPHCAVRLFSLDTRKESKDWSLLSDGEAGVFSAACSMQ